jgi:hypothetical protein
MVYFLSYTPVPLVKIPAEAIVSLSPHLLAGKIMKCRSGRLTPKVLLSVLSALCGKNYSSYIFDYQAYMRKVIISPHHWAGENHEKPSGCLTPKVLHCELSALCGKNCSSYICDYQAYMRNVIINH